MQQAIVTDQDPPWVALRLDSGGFAVPDIHVCPGCLPALADFLPGVPRDAIGAFAQHDLTIDISAGAGHASVPRIAGTATITEEMKTTFQPRRIEIENASHWMIEEFSIADRLQVTKGWNKTGQEIPGEDFVRLMQATAYSAASPGEIISFRVRYVGGNPEGGVWRAKLHGRAAGFPDGGTAA